MLVHGDVPTVETLDSFEALVFSHECLRRCIVPGNAGTQPYGENMYAGGKTIFSASESNTYIETVPMKAFSTSPKLGEFFQRGGRPTHDSAVAMLDVDNAVVPVGLVNRLVSLPDVPTYILARFARDRMETRP